LKIQSKLGKEKFPVVHQNFYPNIGSSDSMLIKPDFPAVIKIGTIDAGGSISSFLNSKQSGK
jgi:hypothetical protein